MTFEARGRHVRLPAEVRADDDGVTVEGYAAVFDQMTDIGAQFMERIAPGAFTDSLDRGDDVVFLINHDGLPLARTGSGTLSLSQDDHGLKVRTRLDGADPDALRIIGKMRRGDLDKMSFAFWVEREEWDQAGDVPVRTILAAALHDVSIVTTPAYQGTEIGLRSLARFRKENNGIAARRRRMRMNLRRAAS